MGTLILKRASASRPSGEWGDPCPRNPPHHRLATTTGIEPPRKLGQHVLALWNTIVGEYQIEDAGGRELLCRPALPRTASRPWRDPYAALNDLTVRDVRQNGKLLLMRFESEEGDVIFRFALDFGNERLEFSVFEDIGVKDAGTADSAERVAEIKRFQRDYFGNGKLHVVNADTGALISRKDAYIPLNMFPDQQAADAEIARWKALAQKRRERGND